MPTRCPVYCRYSSDQQRPESIADQLRHCRQAAALHPDWVILEGHIYTDHAVSGASVEGRTGFKALIEAALSQPRPFDLILVDDTSRLSRDVVDSVQIFRDLRFHGVDFYFVNQGLHSGRDDAEFLLSIYGAMDAEYIRELGRKTRRGQEGQFLKGFSTGGIAYGYRRDPIYAEHRDHHLEPQPVGVRWVIEPAEAETVRNIYRWYAEGLGMDAIAARLNALGVPSPRQAKGHRSPRNTIGTGWDLSSVRVILKNELYRGRRIWNRSRWVKAPGSNRRRRVPNPPSHWVIRDQPELRIVEEPLWKEVQHRAEKIRALYGEPRSFGKSRAAYGKHVCSGLLFCGECQGSLTIRSGSQHRGDQRYGCTRHWRRGATACSNRVLIRRDVVEGKIFALLRERVYTPEAISRLVEKVNARLRAAEPALASETAGVLKQLAEVRRDLEGYRRFIQAGDTSTKVREWLMAAEQEEQRLVHSLAELDERRKRQPLQILPGRAERCLQDLQGTLSKGGPRVRTLLHADIERINVHVVGLDTPKPLARAEVISTGKGLLERVTFMVAGARNHLQANRSLAFRFEVTA